MTKEELRTAVEQYYDFVDDEDYESLFALMADEIVYHHGFDESFDGLEAVKGLYADRPDFNDGAHDIHNILVEPPMVAVRGETWMELADGEVTETRFSLFHHFNDEGKIDEQWLYLERK